MNTLEAYHDSSYDPSHNPTTRAVLWNILHFSTNQIPNPVCNLRKLWGATVADLHLVDGTSTLVSHEKRFHLFLDELNEQNVENVAPGNHRQTQRPRGQCQQAIPFDYEEEDNTDLDGIGAT
ncbi:hypothetical protein HAX54_022217 [Datura stramonium]|uniref:Uncharacterized protein n=1 Tax=Datura stramonium TaxID=4076 RepID=A0ABS8UU68_DATST|nr:hypothetical protein [Datura stramonium]